MCLIAAAGAIGSLMSGGAVASTATAAIASGALTLASTTASLYTAYTGVEAQRGQAKYAAGVATNNATMAKQAALDAESRGARELEDQARQINQFKGRQLATMAARGLDLTTGSPLDILEASDYFGGVDQARTAENTQREAWGLRVQGQNYSSEAMLRSSEASAYSPGLSAGVSLLNAGANVSDKWVTRKYGKF